MGTSVIQLCGVAALCFLVGSINPATILARALGRDLRSSGSGNPGATNAARVLGPRWGVVVLLLDVAKAWLPSLLVLRTMGTLAAIVADTVMFKSPTSTAVDRRMADRMARIANISLDELGKTIFSASISDDKPADALLFTDFKDFHIADHDFGVSQITCVDSERMMQRKDEFLAVMQKTMAERGYTLMILMLTDVLLEGTHLLYLGDEDIITQAFGVQLKDHTCFLPGVVSRKKQVIPMLTALWG